MVLTKLICKTGAIYLIIDWNSSFSNFSYLFIHLFMTKYINKIRATVGTILQILIPKKKLLFLLIIFFHKKKYYANQRLVTQLIIYTFASSSVLSFLLRSVMGPYLITWCTVFKFACNFNVIKEILRVCVYERKEMHRTWNVHVNFRSIAIYDTLKCT